MPEDCRSPTVSIELCMLYDPVTTAALSSVLYSHISSIISLYSDWEAVVKLSDDFNGADLRNVCTEAGKFWLVGESA